MSCGDEKEDPLYTIKIWNKHSGQLLSTLSVHQLTVWCVKLWMDTLVSKNCIYLTDVIQCEVEIESDSQNGKSVFVGSQSGHVVSSHNSIKET